MIHTLGYTNTVRPMKLQFPRNTQNDYRSYWDRKIEKLTSYQYTTKFSQPLEIDQSHIWNLGKVSIAIADKDMHQVQELQLYHDV